MGGGSWGFFNACAHTCTHTKLLRAQVQGRISHSSPTNFTASTVYVWEETLAMLCKPVIHACVSVCVRACVYVCSGHTQLRAGLAKVCLIGCLQVITCPSIPLSCQIISSVTAAIVILLFWAAAEVISPTKHLKSCMLIHLQMQHQCRGDTFLNFYRSV